MNALPLVSVVVPNYNYKRYLNLVSRQKMAID